MPVATATCGNGAGTNAPATLWISFLTKESFREKFIPRNSLSCRIPAWHVPRQNSLPWIPHNIPFPPWDAAGYPSLRPCLPVSPSCPTLGTWLAYRRKEIIEGKSSSLRLYQFRQRHDFDFLRQRVAFHARIHDVQFVEF